MSEKHDNTAAANSNNNGGSNKPLNLFDYNEEELNNCDKFNYYDILNVSLYATSEQIKKSYRKLSLKYHPDKTGLDQDDYVFLAVKHAYETLHDHAKRQAYDSTTLPFDDSIPPSRQTLLQDEMLMYKDEDFYETFRPVFERNLRFDARLRPDLSSSVGNNSKNRHHHHTNKHKRHGHSGPPSLGDANTTIEQVHAFYEYWIHFESWRDFSSQAAEELQVENELENAESRYEKRFYQKEIDKRARQFKKQEMSRIQTLVERAMESDPRLRKFRQEQKLAKERAIQQRKQQQEAKVEEQKRQEQLELDQLEQEKQLRVQEKQQREQHKKLLRKERQILRKWVTTMSTSDHDGNNSNNGSNGNNCLYWKDAYERDQDVEFLCQNLTLEELRKINSNEDEQQSLKKLYDRVQSEKVQQQQQAEIAAAATTTNGVSTSQNAAQQQQQQQQQQKSSWSKEMLSALAKGVKKFPPGGASRWDSITSFVNNLCKTSHKKEDCISMYNQIARNSSNKTTTTTTTTNTSSSSSTAKKTNGDANTTAAAAEANTTSTTTKMVTTKTSSSTAAAIAATDDTTTTNSDGWTTEQDQQLQDALAKFPASMEKNERWTNIAKSVPGKTKKQCVQRFKAIREALLVKNKNGGSNNKK